MTTRLILEMGMGNSLYHADYTTAACRAVQDAIRHSTISLFQSLDIASEDMRVMVTIGVQEPQQVDCQTVAASLPRGQVTVKAVHGGMNVDNPNADTPHVIATAAVEAFVPVAAGAWKLSS